jgi:hypothetical protein
MNFKGRSLAVLCGVLLLGGCGEVNESPTLPGPVQVDPTAFVSAQEYRFTPRLGAGDHQPPVGLCQSEV